MQFKARFRQISAPAWLLWAIVCCVALFATPAQAVGDDGVMAALWLRQEEYTMETLTYQVGVSQLTLSDEESRITIPR